jgi:hypothetical protein
MVDQDPKEIESIRQTKARYVRFGDTQQWDEFSELFTDDFEGVFEIMPRNAPTDPNSATINGRDIFISGMRSLMSGVKSVHQIFSPEIVLTGPDSATGIWAMHDYVSMPNCIFRGWGHYHEVYKKVNGSWLIKRSQTTRLRFEEQWR